MAAAFVFAALGLAALAGLIGWAIGRDEPATTVAPTPSMTTPTGHSGAGLPAHEFGDAARGAKLFVSKRCADCHSYGGRGGTDGPPLDYMAGHLSAREVANMSGTIWDHVPQMVSYFQEESIPFPTFTGFQMADLVAYLHSNESPQAPVPTVGGSEHGSTGMGAMQPGRPARGKRIFSTLGCGGCHTLSAARATGTVGPDLDMALMGKKNAYIEQSLLDPNAIVAKGYTKNTMPSFATRLAKQELADIVAFLALTAKS